MPPIPRRHAAGPRPASSRRRTRPATSRWPPAGLGLLRAPRRRQSMLSDRVIPAALAGKTATVLGDPTSPTPIPTSPTSAKAWLCWVSTPTPRAGLAPPPTIPTPGPPASWSTPSTGSPASPRPNSAAPRCCCCAPWLSPTRPFRGYSSCDMSSRALHRRQHQDRGQARCPRHPAGPGPGRHPSHLPSQLSSVNRRDSGGRWSNGNGQCHIVRHVAGPDYESGSGSSTTWPRPGSPPSPSDWSWPSQQRSWSLRPLGDADRRHDQEQTTAG